MVSSEEFYELPEKDQRKLLDQRQVIADQNPVTEIPDYGVPLQILEKPLASLIFDKLQSARYTVSELAEEIGVRDKHVRNVINQHRHRRFEKLLIDYDGVLRAKDTSGPAMVYSLESIPYSARVLDPTLGCSLLGWHEKLPTYYKVTEWIPDGKAADVDEEHAWMVANYWDLESEDVFDYLTNFERRYVETVLGPLPVLKVEEPYTQIQSRLSDTPEAHSRRKRIDEEKVKDEVQAYELQLARNEVGLPFYQSLVLTLFDFIDYGRHDAPDLVSKVDEQNELVLDWLERSYDERVYSHKETGEPANPESESELIASDTTQTESPEEVGWEERELLIELVALSQELGRLPNETEVNDRTPYSHLAYQQKFGSLINAFKKAGILVEEQT